MSAICIFDQRPNPSLTGIYQIDARLWRKYFAVFRHAWAASAFKGAFGERLLLPDLERHAANNAAWMDVVQAHARQGSAVKRSNFFRGIALTGWSRYDHFAVLCELVSLTPNDWLIHLIKLYFCIQLPVAVPSLVMNLLAVSFPTTSKSVAAAESILGCTMRNNSAPSGTPRQKEGGFAKCSFPGSAVYAVASELNVLRDDIQKCDGSIGR